MEAEIWLAIIGLFATMVGGMAYGIRKWADVKEKQAVHELKMKEKEFDVRVQVEDRRGERERKIMNQNMQTATFIAENTQAMIALRDEIKQSTRSQVDSMEQHTKALSELRRAFEKEIANGISSGIRENREMIARLWTFMESVDNKLGKILESDAK